MTTKELRYFIKALKNGALGSMDAYELTRLLEIQLKKQVEKAGILKPTSPVMEERFQHNGHS